MKYITTPKGAAGYSNLTKPDTKFNADGVYKTSVTISSAQAEDIIAEAHAEAEILLEELNAPVKGKKPAKLKKLEDLKMPFVENDDDTVTFTFKTKKKPKLVDAKGTEIKNAKVLAELRVGSGSLIRVKGAFSHYEGFGGGVNAYLNEVQICKLVEFGGDHGFGADDEEDAYDAGASASEEVPDGPSPGPEDYSQNEDVDF